MMLDEETIALIQSIQGELIAEVAGIYSEDEIESLRTIVRIVIEVSQSLEKGYPAEEEANDLEYDLLTVMSGNDSFLSAEFGYRSLVGALGSDLKWNDISGATIRSEIASAYERMLQATDYLSRYRFVLDLYKLQLALVAMKFG